MALALDTVRAWLEAAEDLAAQGRNRADAEGDATALAGALERAFRLIPRARALTTPETREALAAQAPALNQRVGVWLNWPSAQEGRLRSDFAEAHVTLLGRSLPLPQALALRRSAQESVRAEAERAVAAVLSPLADRLSAWAEAQPAPPLLGPRGPTPPPAGRAGLFVPSAAMVEQIALGILDPASLHPAPPAEVRPTVVTERPLAELAAALFEAVNRSPEAERLDWVVARAGTRVADFRPRPLTLLGRLSGVVALPFEQPGVPWARPGAAVYPGPGAGQLLAHLLGAGSLAGPWSLGGALAFSACGPSFLSGGLEERPGDLLAARRTVVLAMTLIGWELSLASASADDRRRLGMENLGVAPSPLWLRLQAAETLLHRAPGEDRALYAQDGPGIRAAWWEGWTGALRLRERFDEDWWRNPRAHSEAVLDALRGTEPASSADIYAGLKQLASL